MKRMTNEQQELVNKAIALLEKARDIEEIHGWLKSRVKRDEIELQAAIEDFNDREQTAYTREFIAVLDRLTQTIIKTG